MMTDSAPGGDPPQCNAGITPSVPERMEALSALFEEQLKAYVREQSADGAPVENLHDAMAHALGTDIEEASQRGKRIRPILCLLTAEALGADLERAMPFALAIELMHNFALVHDDMEDGDIMRRGREAIWVKYGPPHAINVGDYLLVHTMRVLTSWGAQELDGATRFRLMNLLAVALDHTHIGQALDINARSRRSITPKQYLRLVREKTGFYLAAPIQGGAIVAGASPETIDAIGEMAQFLGPMFQIIDDIIDLTDGKGREATGSDIREGKRSFLVAESAKKCTPDQRERLFDILDKSREATETGDIEEVRALFEQYGAIESGRAYCHQLLDQSKAILKQLPSPLGDQLEAVVELLVNRSH
jgi:geranylgeranyl pyrophosphate synthase